MKGLGVSVCAAASFSPPRLGAWSQKCTEGSQPDPLAPPRQGAQSQNVRQKDSSRILQPPTFMSQSPKCGAEESEQRTHEHHPQLKGSRLRMSLPRSILVLSQGALAGFRLKDRSRIWLFLLWALGSGEALAKRSLVLSGVSDSRLLDTVLK